MQPTKTWEVVLGVHSRVTFAVISQAPGARPNVWVVGNQHAALATGGHDLVLAERKSCRISQRANWPAFVSRALRLRTILDHPQIAFFRERENSIHFARPAGQMDNDNRPGPRCHDALNGFGCDVLTLRVYISADRACA